MESIKNTNAIATEGTVTFASGIQLLDEAYEMLINGLAGETVTSLVMGTKRLREELPLAEWTTFAKEIVPQHPVCKLIHEDPFTFYSYSKPRGYSGDAELLDFIYGMKDYSGSSELGKALYTHTYEASACKSVRIRRRLLASTIDLLAMEVANPKILSVACGHLREAQNSLAVQERMIGEFVALDQDQNSLSVVNEEQGKAGIRTANASVRALLIGKLSFSDFDLVYSAGLFDYLAPETARRLTAALFAMIKPGGKVLVANFAPELDNIGFMECFMNWQLLYRSESQVHDFASAIPQTQIAQQRVYRDRLNNVIYLEIVKA